MKKIITRKGGNCECSANRGCYVVLVVLGFNYETHNVPLYKFNTPASSFRFGNTNFLSCIDVLVIDQHFPVFFPCFYCAWTEAAVSELVVSHCH